MAAACCGERRAGIGPERLLIAERKAVLRRASEQGCGWAGPCALPPAPRPCGPRSPVLLAPQGRLRPSASHGRHRPAVAAYARTSTCSPSRRRLGGVAMPLGGLRCSAPSTRARACPPAVLRTPPWYADGVPRWCSQSRGRVCAGSDICGAEERRARGRARSAQRLLTRRDCSIVANAVSEESFATGHEHEYRRGPGAQRRAAASERRRIPARGFATALSQHAAKWAAPTPARGRPTSFP